MIPKFEVPYEFHVHREGKITVRSSKVKLASGTLKMVRRPVTTFEDTEKFLLINL